MLDITRYCDQAAGLKKISMVRDDADHVTKFVYEWDGAVAEAVLYRYPDYGTRTVICCSTQSGCPIGCRFCGAGDYFVRSLTADEIVFQAKHCIEQTGLKATEIGRLQIMFMSMGEPLLNLKHLVPAIHRLYALYSRASLLVSTSAPSVDFEPLTRVSVEVPTVGLQFSVHESTDEARAKLIPFKNKLSLSEISKAGEAWYYATERRPFFNYCVHDKNNTEDDAQRLFQLFDPNIWNATVSVICERSSGFTTSNEYQRKLALDFSQKLLLRGYDVRVFDPAGQDTIGGGCGQLKFVQDWLKDHPERARPSVGYGLPIVHSPCKCEAKEKTSFDDTLYCK